MRASGELMLLSAAVGVLWVSVGVCACLMHPSVCLPYFTVAWVLINRQVGGEREFTEASVASWGCREGPATVSQRQPMQGSGLKSCRIEGQEGDPRGFSTVAVHKAPASPPAVLPRFPPWQVLL